MPGGERMKCAKCKHEELDHGVDHGASWQCEIRNCICTEFIEGVE